MTSEIASTSSEVAQAGGLVLGPWSLGCLPSDGAEVGARDDGGPWLLLLSSRVPRSWFEGVSLVLESSGVLVLEDGWAPVSYTHLTLPTTPYV